MNSLNQKANAFAALYVKGTPLILHNIWDVGSAKSVAEAGAAAIATGSWAVAAAQGFGDGQALPLVDLVRTSGQIVRAVDVPVSVDFEGGYAVAPDALARNLRIVLDTGIVGINFEDRIVGGEGLHDTNEQSVRIAALRAASDRAGVALFINARTDVFFQNGDIPHADLMTEAVSRAKAYADAGADGLFLPGLGDADLIRDFCAQQPLLVNIMRIGDALDIATLARCGVARISHGPAPYIAAMKALSQATTGITRGLVAGRTICDANRDKPRRRH